MNARALHDSLIVIDALQASAWDRETLEELRAGGVTAVNVTLVYWEDARATLDRIGQWHRLFERHGDLVMPARSAQDIEQAKRSGKVAIVFGLQNCSPIEDDLALVQVFHELGVRIMQLTYNNQSLIGAGCYEKVDAGISRFDDGVFAVRCWHVNNGGIRLNGSNGFAHGVEHWQAEVSGTTFTWGDTANHFGAVGNRLFAVESALFAGEALANHFGVFVN